ncbi:MAG: hypothetical protein F4Y80_08940 [Caldilineaceae bacterium SB0665_bin_21]|nr:hypothetical protein [Caldilineaceae bacterium SB0665_bin_21]MYA04634.1 hypothetical protein [Caldilineaceae bacterium SB0664_bin_22]
MESTAASRLRLCSGGVAEDGPKAFRELCRALEGRVHPTLQAKQDARELILKTRGWDWIRKALTDLSADPQAA